MTTLSVAFYKNKSAEKLFIPEKSLGKSKKRIEFSSLEGTDRYLIAYDSVIQTKNGVPPKLGFFANKRFVLLKSNEGYIKVNANSLRKRFEISKKELAKQKKCNNGDLTQFIASRIQKKLTVDQGFGKIQSEQRASTDMALIHGLNSQKFNDIPPQQKVSTISDTYTTISTSELNTLVYTQAAKIAEKKLLYWMPHPLFTNSEGPFPDEYMNVPDFYGSRHCMFYFGKEETLKLFNSKFTKNYFLEWLNERPDSEQLSDSKMNISQILEHPNQHPSPIFMSCADFFYLSLYKAKVITKDQILQIYQSARQQQMMDDQASAISTHFYGFDTHQFEDMESMTTQGKPGDVVIGFDENNKPMHIMFLGKPGSALGLWRLPTYHAVEFKLKEIEWFKMKLKWCPLQKGLDNLLANITMQ